MPHATTFRGEHLTVTTGNALVKNAIGHLALSWPAFIPTAELMREARAITEPAIPQDESILLDDLMTFLTRDIIQVAKNPPPVSLHPGDSPEGSLLARRMAELGPVVTSRAHRSVAIDDLSRFIITRLDGKHRRDRLISELSESIRQEQFQVRQGDHPLEDVDRVTCEEILDHVLRSLVEQSLIIQ
jgi:hypothetical protein